MLTERNVQKFYPETIETAKGHLNQTRKNVRSTKAKPTPLETCDTSQLHGKKVRDVYTETDMVRETMFSDQTGQFPTRSQRGNKFIMVMVEIDSNAILVEPMKSRKDEEMMPVQCTPTTTEANRHYPKEARPRQQSFKEHEEPHTRHLHIRHGISTARMSPTQRS
jgi:hypothetical protein